jgi:hypothetical protein
LIWDHRYCHNPPSSSRTHLPALHQHQDFKIGATPKCKQPTSATPSNHNPTGIHAIIRQPHPSRVVRSLHSTDHSTDQHFTPLERNSNTQLGETWYLKLYPRPHVNLLLASTPASTTCIKRHRSPFAALRILSFVHHITSYHDTHDTCILQIDSYK